MRVFRLILALLLLGLPAVAQETPVADPAADAQAADEAGDEAGDVPAPPCGTRPLSIARMSWPAAALLAEIHAQLLTAFFQCNVSVVDGDLAATGSSMGLTGEPAVAPELWVSRIPDLWNSAVTGQAVRRAGSSYDADIFEGWFLPDYLATAFKDIATPEGLRARAPGLRQGGKPRFISCPPDWACALINRNLLKALGLDDLFEVIEPANRFDMDKLIAEAVSRKEPVVFYYWRPNAILSQFAFQPVALPAYDPVAYACLARVACPEPKPSGFPAEPVVIALAERVYTDTPLVAAYFSRAQMPIEVMNGLLMQLQAPGATVETVAEAFVSSRQALWSRWVGQATPPAQ